MQKTRTGIFQVLTLQPLHQYDPSKWFVIKLLYTNHLGHKFSQVFELIEEAGELDDAERSLANLDKALDLAPQLSHAWFDKGIYEYKLKHLEAAMASLKEAVRLNPEDGLGYTVLGLLHYDICDYHTAEYCLRKATTVSPDESLVWSMLGVFLCETQQSSFAITAKRLFRRHDSYQEAEDYLNRAIDLDLNCTLALAGKAWIKEQSGDVATAAASYIVAHMSAVDNVWILVRSRYIG